MADGARSLESADETPTGQDVPPRRSTSRAGTVAGQHFVVRLTAPDGYQRAALVLRRLAPGDDGEIELTVERLDDGEVSTVPPRRRRARRRAGGARPDRRLVRVGRRRTRPLLVGGGSGVVPLMAMLRLARRTGAAPTWSGSSSPCARPDDLYYADELPGPETTVVYTRSAPPGSTRPAGRLAVGRPRHDRRGGDGLRVRLGRLRRRRQPLLLDAGVPAERIRVERFGPTG